MEAAGITHVTEEITPGVAAKYLQHNNLNRPVRERRVRELMEDMLAGRWQENGEAGVTFDLNGDIAGGQHTLEAVVRSGVTIRCRVTRGVDPAARSTMNDSMKQRYSDDLHLMGVASSHRVEALLRKVAVWERAAQENADGLGGLARWSSMRFSRAELAELAPRYIEGMDRVVRECYRWKLEWPLVGNVGALEFMYWLLTEKSGCNKATVDDFFNRLALGSTDDDDKILARVRLRLRAKPNGAAYQVWWLCKGWNAWTSAAAPARLQLPRGADLTDPFPGLRRAR